MSCRWLLSQQAEACSGGNEVSLELGSMSDLKEAGMICTVSCAEPPVLYLDVAGALLSSASRPRLPVWPEG